MRIRTRLPAMIAVAILLCMPRLALAGASDTPENSEKDGPLRTLWKEHRWHLLTVFLLEEADYYYEKEVGPPDEPRLFGSPPAFDRAVANRFADHSGGPGFIASNKSTITQLLALSAIAWTNGDRWGQSANDVIGLIEAHKINWSITSLVKNIAGRRRPSLQRDYEAGNILVPPTRSKRNSFYSDAASNAFTTLAYTDSILARKFQGNRKARIWSAVGLYGLAGAIAWSRVEQGQHYPSDVIAGAGAGFLVGKSVYRWNHDDRDREDRAWTIRPMLAPGGAGVSVSIRLGQAFAPREKVR